MIDADQFLEQFFGPGNGLEWGKLQQEWDKWLQPWIDRVRHQRYPIFLPRWTGHDRMVWYAVAASPAAGAELTELITAFVGSSYAEFSGRLAQLETDDPVDRAVVQHLGETVYQFTVPRPEDTAAVRITLDRLRNLLDSRPADTRQLSRPAGRILRDFELALVSGEDGLSKQLIEELLANGHLSTANISFLEVVRLADLGDWDGVLSHRDLPRLVEMRRPVRVTAALVEAVYRKFFLEFDEAGDVAGAKDIMSEIVLPRYGALYQGAQAKGTFPLRSLLLVQLATAGARTTGATQLLELAKGDDGRFTSLLAGELKTSRPPADETPQEALALARVAMAEGQPQVAMDLVDQAAKSAERTVLMLQCAYELNTLADANLALAAYDNLDVSDRASLPQSRQFRDLLASIQGLAGAPGESIQSPGGWADWFKRVASDPGSHAHAVKWAQLGADEWGPDEFHDEVAVKVMTEHLGQGGDEVVALHREALPYFLRALAQSTTAAALPLQRQVLDTLLYRGTHSRAELDVLLDVLEITVADMDSAQYRQVLEDLTSVWSTIQSPASLEWAVQALDILAYQPCRDQAGRQTFATGIFATANAYQRRVDVPLRLTLDEISREIGISQDVLLEEETAGVAVTDPLEALKGQRVAVYTLTESAGIRARDQLSVWTKAGVELLSDKVCSEALRVAARESDIFIMVTRSAKHAATDCIKEYRPPGLPLLITSGKGTSSVMYAVRRYLAEAGEVAALPVALPVSVHRRP